MDWRSGEEGSGICSGNSSFLTAVLSGANTSSRTGSLLGSGSVLNSDSILNGDSVLNSDSALNDGPVFDNGSTLNGGSAVNRDCVLGSGSVLKSGSVFGDGLLLNSGSFLGCFSALGREISTSGICLGNASLLSSGVSLGNVACSVCSEPTRTNASLGASRRSTFGSYSKPTSSIFGACPRSTGSSTSVASSTKDAS